MRRRLSLQRDEFAPFSINAHRNGARAGHAVLKRTIDAPAYRDARPLASPVHVRVRRE